MTLASERLAKRAALLRISAKKLAENMQNGNFKSLRRGQGIEFSDVREYLPGDAVRSIDWNVTARMGRAFIKQYEEDRELSVLIILDCSRSMESAIQSGSKLAAAQEAAALLLLACEQNSAAIGAVLFDGKIQFSCAPKSGKENAMMIFSKLDRLNSIEENEKSNGSALSGALNGAAHLLKKRSLIFVISDFRTANWEHHFAKLAPKNDLVAIKITDSCDKAIPKMGTAPFFDPETKQKATFPTLSKDFAAQWQEAEENRTDIWKEFCAKHGARSLLISTEDDCVQVLSHFFNCIRA